MSVSLAATRCKCSAVPWGRRRGVVAATVRAAVRRNLRGAAAWVYIRAPAKARGRRRLEEESFTLFVCVDMRPERRKRALRVPLHPLSTLSLRLAGWWRRPERGRWWWCGLLVCDERVWLAEASTSCLPIYTRTSTATMAPTGGSVLCAATACGRRIIRSPRPLFIPQFYYHTTPFIPKCRSFWLF